MKLQIPGRKFIITIGDDGINILLLENKMAIENFFVASSPTVDVNEIKEIFANNPYAPVYVLLDTIEQTCIKQILPGVDLLSIGKLVKRRLEKDFAKSDLKGAIPLGHDAVETKDWAYMFISAPMTTALASWLEYFSSLKNPFSGIYFLPIEMENIISGLDQSGKTSGWQLILTHNKTSGFRQTVLHGNKVIFTRLTTQSNDSSADLIAGNIEQELANSIDYLHRLGLRENDQIEICAIVSQELKTSMSTTIIKGAGLTLYTPFEFAKALGYSNLLKKDAKFSDILLSTIFANSTKYTLKIKNPKAPPLNISNYTTKTIVIACILWVLLLYLW